VVEHSYFFYQIKTPPFPIPQNRNIISPQKTGREKQTHKSIHRCQPFNIQYLNTNQPMAYFWVQLRAVASYLARSVLYMWAISGTSGSSGFGSVSNEHIESSTWHDKQNIIITKLIIPKIPLKITNEIHMQ